jgi:hypothetical protein
MYYKSDLITWSMHGGTVMKTRLDVAYGSDYELHVTISEGNWEYAMEKPMKIDPKRLVLQLLMLVALIYAIRLRINPTFKLNIHNRCWNVGLVSPTYITGDGLGCHIPPSRKVCIGDTMRSGFTIKSDDASYGALIYRLQRKNPDESIDIGEGVSSVAYLLVVWDISKFKNLYADVLLLEHDERFDRDNLRVLYHRSIDQFRQYLVPVIETWSLDDNTALTTTFKIMNEGCLLDITISEVERYNCARTPVRIDPER